MNRIKKHIEIVSSSDRRLSSMSHRSRQSAQAALSKHYTNVGVSIVNNQLDLENLVAKNPDLVFLGMEYVPGDQEVGSSKPAKLWIADYLDQFGIAYTGSGQLAHHLQRNKPLAKQQVLDAGLQTSPYIVAAQQDLARSWVNLDLDFPLFVKPTNRGGGQGVNSDSLVRNLSELETKVGAIARRHGADSLIEEYLSGREFSVAILKNIDSEDYQVMPIELIAEPDIRGVQILAGSVKSSNTEQVVKVTDIDLKAKVNNLAIDVFKALGARDYGRIDIRLNKAGVPQFLEANLIPSLIDNYGSFPKACQLNNGLSYVPMILQIVELGLARAIDDIELGLTSASLIPSYAF